MKQQPEPKTLSLREVVGGGYDEFFRSKQRYVVCKGSRASKKSTSAALKIIVRMMQYPLSNTLVIRQTAESLRDSCFAQLRWAIDRLGVNAWWKAKVSPMEIEYIPTGQRIIFRGLDDPLKITSVTVKHGFICFAWLEEAFEVSEDAFNRVDESLRGQMPDNYYIQWLITLNPWDSGCWVKGRFFDTPDPDVLAMTTTYKCNEWLSDADMRMFDRMELTDPERYKVAGLGDWGVAEGQFFRQWRSDLHVVEPFAIPDSWIKVRSMDWGSAAPYSCHWYAIDYDGNIWAYKELYGWGGKPNVGTGETAKQVAQKIIDMEDKGEVHHAILDCACWAKTGVTGPSIAEEMNNALHDANVSTFAPSSKGRAEMANAIKERLIGNEQEDGSFKPALYVFANCVHLIRTLPMLAHDKSKPETYDTKGEDHAVDDLGYMCLSRPWAPTVKKPAKKLDRWERRRKEKPRSAWTY
jgi:phage terminase large subunit